MTPRPKCFRRIALVFLLVAGTAAAQDSRAAERARLDRELEGIRARFDLPALQAAAARDGAVVYEGAAGLTDLENDVRATSQSRFRTASIAKPLTALALMALVEAGKIDLDADIRTYVPAFPEKPWPVTVAQLLCHQGGVRHYAKPGESDGTRRYRTLEASLAPFKDDPLVAEPGTKHHYTTYGYTLLGCAIERASGAEYFDELRRAVLTPAGMSDTGLDTSDELVPRRAQGYRRAADSRPGAFLNAPLSDTSMKIPGGGLRSTAGDLVRLAVALMEGRVVRPETRDRMWTARPTKDGKATEYGLGFGVARTKDGTKDGGLRVSHSGSQAGAACLIVILPEKRRAYAVMTNLQGAPIREIAADFASAADV
jgi:serine beta-lactamase-like protein LACTB